MEDAAVFRDDEWRLLLEHQDPERYDEAPLAYLDLSLGFRLTLRIFLAALPH